jgi:sigma-B regulation protein RsbU (phosphoserine phosphatase)
MQAMLFPAGLPNDHQLEFAAYYQPHHQVGGDYYDFIRLNNEEVLFCVADVSGKGVSAALLMSNFQANLRALASAEKTLSALVGELNLKVLQSAKGEKFITFFVARYNTKNRNLDYINAGHNPPLLTSKNGIEVLQKGCPGLGILDKLSSVTTGSVQVEPGSFLLCYTDGLVEQENEGGKDFGLEQLTKFLETEQALSAAEFNSHLVKYLSAFKGVKPFVDDIALLSCRFF